MIGSGVERTLWLVVLAGSLSGCEGGVGSGSATASGGAGGSSSSSTTSSSGGGTGVACIEPPGNRCDSPEDCGCAVCAPAAMCRPGGEGCVLNGSCEPLEDACTCSDCAWAARCFDGQEPRCNGDGTCDFASEGCACADCVSAATCLDDQALCTHGAADGACDLLEEDCSCTDCLGTYECLCPVDGDCDEMPCICPDCWTAADCDDPTACVDDGRCAWDEAEGCACADCADLDACAGYGG